MLPPMGKFQYSQSSNSTDFRIKILVYKRKSTEKVAVNIHSVMTTIVISRLGVPSKRGFVISRDCTAA